jgi:hypothetical protein
MKKDKPKIQSPEIVIPTIEELRDSLLKETPQQGESADKRSGFVNGVLDMYNAIKKRQDTMIELAGGD